MAEENNQPSQYLSGWKLWVVILSLFLGTFLLALDTNIVIVAIPHIVTEFKTLQDVSWYGSAYLLTVTAFQPIFGVVYKYFKVEFAYMCCIILFEVGSTLCAAAVNSQMFIVGRAVAGLGAAGLLQGALCVIGHVVVLKDRAMYIGIVVSVYVISICIGPVLGGFFTTHTTWRWCFWINLPCGAITLVLLSIFLRIRNEDSANRKLPLKTKLAHLEPVGCFTFLGAVTCLLLALQWGGQSLPWKSATIIGLFIGFGILFTIFVFVQWKRGEKAMVPLRVLRQRSVWTTACVLFSISCPLYLDAYYLPFFYQTVQAADAITSGIRLMPLMIPEVVAMVIAGVVVAKTGHLVPMMLLGEILACVGSGLLVTLKVDTPTTTWATFLVIAGLGLGTTMQLPYTAIQIAVPKDDVPVANAIAIFSSQLGGAIAIAVGQAITLNVLINEGREKLPEIPVQAIVAAGATGIGTSGFPAAVATVIRQIWASAITKAFAFSVATIVLTIPFTCAMKWLNAKFVSAGHRKPSLSSTSSDTAINSIDEEKGSSINKALTLSNKITENPSE